MTRTHALHTANQNCLPPALTEHALEIFGCPITHCARCPVVNKWIFEFSGNKRIFLRNSRCVRRSLYVSDSYFSQDAKCERRKRTTASTEYKRGEKKEETWHTCEEHWKKRNLEFYWQYQWWSPAGMDARECVWTFQISESCVLSGKQGESAFLQCVDESWCLVFVEIF